MRDRGGGKQAEDPGIQVDLQTPNSVIRFASFEQINRNSKLELLEMKSPWRNENWIFHNE